MRGMTNICYVWALRVSRVFEGYIRGSKGLGFKGFRV